MSSAAVSSLPENILQATEELVKAAVASEFERMQRFRRLLTDAIEQYGRTMYDGGIELGLAQAEGRSR